MQRFVTNSAKKEINKEKTHTCDGCHQGLQGPAGKHGVSLTGCTTGAQQL